MGVIMDEGGLSSSRNNKGQVSSTNEIIVSTITGLQDGVPAAK